MFSGIAQIDCPGYRWHKNNGGPQIKSLGLLTALDNENLTKEQLQRMAAVNPKLQLMHTDVKIVPGEFGDANGKLMGTVGFAVLGGEWYQLYSWNSSDAVSVGTKCYVICDDNSLVEAEITYVGQSMFQIRAQNNEPIKKGHEVRVKIKWG